MKRKSRSRKEKKSNSGALSRVIGYVGKGALLMLSVLMLFVGVRLGWDWYKRDWQGIEPYRVLVQVEGDDGVGLYLLQTQVDSRDARTLKIPDDVVIDVVGGYGEYRVGAISELSDLENKGDELVIDSVMHAMGVRIRELVRLKDRSFQGQEKLFMYAGMNQLIRSLVGQGNMYEVVEMLKASVWLREGDVVVNDLDDYQVYQSLVDVDGSEVRYFDEALLDKALDDVLGEAVSGVREYSVVVENNTSAPGLARQWARIMRREGFSVVGEVNGLSQNAMTELVLTDATLVEKLPVKVMESLFSGVEMKVEEEKQADYRSDIVVRLGEDATRDSKK